MSYNSFERTEETRQYRHWIDGLNDRVGRARILVRVDRLVHGHAGVHRALGGSMFELKIDHGPGYRVYYTVRQGRLLLLLAGGDKSSQQKDIDLARGLALQWTE